MEQIDLNHRLSQLQKLKGIAENHIISDSQQNISAWVADGKPANWIEVETNGNYTVYVDHSYGWLALFDNNTLLCWGKETMYDCGGVVVLDKEYYSASKYIWL
jgi:hypothetical protein